MNTPIPSQQPLATPYTAPDARRPATSPVEQQPGQHHSKAIWNSPRGYSRLNEVVTVVQERDGLIEIVSEADVDEPDDRAFGYWVRPSELTPLNTHDALVKVSTRDNRDRGEPVAKIHPDPRHYNGEAA